MVASIQAIPNRGLSADSAGEFSVVKIQIVPVRCLVAIEWPWKMQAYIGARPLDLQLEFVLAGRSLRLKDRLEA
jgi:hypothetical protein